MVIDAQRKVAEAQKFVADAMDIIRTAFKPGVKIAVLVRTPHLPDRDFMMTDDMPGELIAMIKRRQVAPKPEAKRPAATTPSAPGFYWAKWRVADQGDAKTAEYESYLPNDDWEVVQVVVNCIDRDDPEYLRVEVLGVTDGQALENFFWGPGPLEIPA